MSPSSYVLFLYAGGAWGSSGNVLHRAWVSPGILLFLDTGRIVGVKRLCSAGRRDGRGPGDEGWHCGSCGCGCRQIQVAVGNMEDSGGV